MPDPQPDQYVVHTTDVEYLASSAGRRDGKTFAVITFRLLGTHQGSLDFTITKKAARRLCRDLRRLLTTKGSWLAE
jgi:hypothetical protein